MASGARLKPLHGLYQVLEAAGESDLEHPLVCMAQLARRPSSTTESDVKPSTLSHMGQVEWIVAVGTSTERPAIGRPTKRRKKEVAPQDVWWEARFCEREIEELLQQVDGSVLTPETAVPKVRTSWLSGMLEVKGYREGEESRGRIEMIHPFLSASQDRADAAALRKQLEHLNTEHDKVCKLLELERDGNPRQKRRPGTQLRHFSDEWNAGGAPFGRRRSSQEQSQGGTQSSTGYDARFPASSPTSSRGASASPTKAIPGVTQPGMLKPGDPGYAGSSRRIGRVVEDTPWDEDPPTDSD